mgnify:FL=1
MVATSMVELHANGRVDFYCGMDIWGKVDRDMCLSVHRYADSGRFVELWWGKCLETQLPKWWFI